MPKLVAGVGEYSRTGKYLRKDYPKIYACWNAMLRRCYNPKDANYHRYGGKGTTVCKAWHLFDNYCEWHLNHVQPNQVVDKDLNQLNEYSPAGCTPISQSKNIHLSLGNSYTFKDPLGNVHYVSNLKEHCELHGLNLQCMRRVHRGGREHHKQWRKA